MRKDKVQKRMIAGAVVPLLIFLGIFGSAWKTTSSLTTTLPKSNLQISISVPSANDWQPGVQAFSRGSGGEWDRYLWGGFANSLVKKGNKYYLYYQGSKSYNSQCDEVSNRAIGVATSTDGVHWTKSPDNPVVTWSSSGGPTEGAASSAVWVGQDGRIYLYYGANSQYDSTCLVHANGRLAVSDDGEHFQDLGEVLSSSNSSVWGYGDELFPVGAYSYGGKWYLYYIPNGVPNTGILGSVCKMQKHD